MIGLSKLILSVYVYFMVLNTVECQVNVTNLNGTGNFLCGYSTTLVCAIPGYGGGMSWKLDGTIIAQCAFSSCSALGALPSGDNFTADEANRKFYLEIGITHADNGTMYQCDDGLIQDQTTVNIQVPPSEGAFTTNITENDTSITVEAGCFYPSDAGRMDVYCVSNGQNVEAAITMTPTTTGCAGDCAGPNIYTAVGSYAINDSITGGNSMYRFEVYHKDFKQNAVTYYSTAKYNCGISTTSTSTTTTITTTSTNTSTTSTTSTLPTTTATRDNDISITIITSIIGGCVILLCIVALIAFLYRRIVCNVKSTKASGDNHIPQSERKSKSNNNNPKSDEISKYDHLFSTRGNEYRNTAENYRYTYEAPYFDPLHTNSYSGLSSNTHHTYSSVNPHSMSIQVQNATRNVRAHRSAPLSNASVRQDQSNY